MIARPFLLVGDGEAHTPAARRHEFRCWPDRLSPVAGLLQGAWPLVACEHRTDIYLLSTLSPFRLVKLRRGETLEIKYLTGHSGALEVWSEPRKLPFPLAPTALATLAADLATAPRFGASAHLSPAHMLADITERGFGVRVLTVAKSRALFQRGTCRVEIAHVALGGRRRLSLAVEDPDRQGAQDAVDALGLARFANLSYGAALTGRPLIPRRYWHAAGATHTGTPGRAMTK